MLQRIVCAAVCSSLANKFALTETEQWDRVMEVVNHIDTPCRYVTHYTVNRYTNVRGAAPVQTVDLHVIVDT